MHQMSPGVERAVAKARALAERFGAAQVCLTHYLLALLEEEEGRPAVLLERAGYALGEVRSRLENLKDSPPAPAESVLFDRARNWSLAHRHDPEFLTDAFLLVVLRADTAFERVTASLGLDNAQLEGILTADARQVHDEVAEHGTTPQAPAHSASFVPQDSVSEMDAARVLDANFNRAREASRS